MSTCWKLRHTDKAEMLMMKYGSSWMRDCIRYSNENCFRGHRMSDFTEAMSLNLDGVGEILVML